MKKFFIKLKFASALLVGIAVILASIWQFSKPYTYAAHFVQIPFGHRRHQLSTCRFNYLAVQGFHMVGIVSFNEKLNVCISDGYKKFFFDGRGRLKGMQISRELENLLALSLDGSIWSITRISHPPNRPSDQSLFSSDCIRKYDSQGKLIFQFGQPPSTFWLKKINSTRSREVQNFLRKRYRHLFGKAYQFGNAQLFGLWIDRKGRLYVLTEYPSLHIFDANGNPLGVFNFESGVTFERERRDLEGAVQFVDLDGRIYTYTLELAGKIKVLRFRWKGWKELPWEVLEEEVWVGRIEVWEWSPKVRKVRRLTPPENGCVVGVDIQENIYWMSFDQERVYRIKPNGKTQKIFEPRRFYRGEIVNEWEKVFRKESGKREKLEIERWRKIAEMEQVEPRPKRLIKFCRDLYEYAMEYGDGPRTGHIAYVDKEGNLYITLVTATHFRIDKIERASRWERWWRKVWGKR